MKIFLHKNFERQYKKLTKKEQNKFKEKAAIFIEDPYNEILNNHPLQGKYKGHRSVNITGDIRAVYEQKTSNSCLFVAIDTHSNLYS